MRASLASITRCSLASGAVRFAALVPHVLPAPLSGVTRVVGAPCSLSRGPVACALSHATRSLVWWRMGFVCSPLVRFALLALLACCLRSFARRPACLVSQVMLAPLVVSCVLLALRVACVTCVLLALARSPRLFSLARLWYCTSELTGGHELRSHFARRSFGEASRLAHTVYTGRSGGPDPSSA